MPTAKLFMKNYLFPFISLFIAFLSPTFAIENMIPKTPAKNSMNSWCSWAMQHDYIQKQKERLKKGLKVPQYILQNPEKVSQRDGIIEDSIFGKDGWAYQKDAVRGDMYFILDDGWDVDFFVYPWGKANDMHKFGSHILNDKRFPSIAGKSPKEKLKWINQKLQNLGWKGVAIWIPSHALGQKKAEDFSKHIDYWKERIEWSKYAGVKYWKVDWGFHCLDSQFRRELTALAAKEFPELIIENVCPLGDAECFANDINFNNDKVGGTGTFKGFKNLERLYEILSFSTLFRTYDELGSATTIDRVANILSEAYKNNLNVFLTCESHPKIAAATASYIGCMDNDNHPNSRDTIAFLRWQRIAPAVAANQLPTKFSEARLTDFYVHKSYEKSKGQPFPQSAPAIVVRGKLDFPKISYQKDKNPPFVIATLHREGQMAISFIERKNTETTLVDAQFYLDCLNRKTAIFGLFNSITFNVSKTKNLKVWIQDLCSDTPFEIKNYKLCDNKLTIRLTDIPFKDSISSKQPAFILFISSD